MKSQTSKSTSRFLRWDLQLYRGEPDRGGFYPGHRFAPFSEVNGLHSADITPLNLPSLSLSGSIESRNKSVEKAGYLWKTNLDNYIIFNCIINSYIYVLV